MDHPGRWNGCDREKKLEKLETWIGRNLIDNQNGGTRIDQSLEGCDLTDNSDAAEALNLKVGPSAHLMGLDGDDAEGFDSDDSNIEYEYEESNCLVQNTSAPGGFHNHHIRFRCEAEGS